ncbi:four-carbon acid sugar kinase family protein [Aromatoleum diolicum]|uniref:Four-carbon acid sugar kinase family protein n=1 Tax=Aromatoleum diolicum TaxID=75796 RepID=A0ABX1Q5J0_9RHOO|nr:four-carbon acid sugar kinase family protein [Aromatoleum diolicum]NMG73626.1 four-carbon acid sugar kinase family protein [Aromatoleum diolicum]
MNDDLLLSYYGDDLTGSTDVMESLAMHGVPTVLFVKRPNDAQRARFPDVRAIGLAGTSRSESPAWMDAQLPEAFAWLKGLGAALCHYKVCSTFDSAPTVGSIGRALDLGAAAFAQKVTPVVVGVPQMRRYTVFGNHFAAVNGVVHRLDRHPVMSRHPVTPMDDADLTLHLGKQTTKRIALADYVMLGADDADTAIARLMDGKDEVLLFDVPDRAIQKAVGRQLWRHRRPGGSFVVGSSGVEYALIQQWIAERMIPGSAEFASPGAVERIAVVSGSCSEVTARQIRWAEHNGFAAIALDARRLASTIHGPETFDAALADGVAALKRGQSVVLYTALGPDSNLVDAADCDESFRHRIGQQLGGLLKRLIERESLKRVVIAGGDTSSHALQQLGVFALTTRLPLPETPGSPLCTAHSEEARFDGLQIALKGGQIGSEAYFGNIRDGRR